MIIPCLILMCQTSLESILGISTYNGGDIRRVRRERGIPGHDEAASILEAIVGESLLISSRARSSHSREVAIASGDIPNSMNPDRQTIGSHCRAKVIH